MNVFACFALFPWRWQSYCKTSPSHADILS